MDKNCDIVFCEESGLDLEFKPIDVQKSCKFIFNRRNILTVITICTKYFDNSSEYSFYYLLCGFLE